MLQEIFSTEERIRILEIVLYEKGLTNSIISRRAEVNKGLVSIFLRSLIEKGILEKRDRQYYFRTTPLVRQLKLLMNLSKLQCIEKEISTDTIGLGLFGSWAKGTNDEQSDIDIWIMMKEIDNEAVSRIIGWIERRTGSEPNLLLLTPEKWKRMKQEDVPFTSSMIRDTILLAGEGIG
jgi:hypothetical protein